MIAEIHRRFNWRYAAAVLVALTLLSGLHALRAAAPTDLFFSEYIEGSSNNKALEIYNGTGAPVTLTDTYSIQMYFNGSSSVGLTIPLIGTVADGDVFVVTNQSANATIKAQADLITASTSWYNGDDAVALVKGTTNIDVIGQIGFDPGSEWGSGLTSTQDNTLRRKAGVMAGDPDGSNAFDPGIEWDGFPQDTFSGLGCLIDVCPPPPASDPSGTGAATPSGVDIGENSLLTVTVVPGANPTSTNLSVVVDLSAIGGSATQTFYDDGTHGDATANNNVFSYEVTVPSGTASGANGLPFTITDGEGRSAAGSFTLSVVTVIAINAIQGSAQTSPLVGQTVATTGIVTAKTSNGFWMQNPTPDGDDATSEGVFVYTGGAPTVALGDAVRVSAVVQEYIPGGASSHNLSTTELGSPSIVVKSSGNPLPPPTIIGAGGRIPPSAVIDDDGMTSYDPASDGIDFYESMEGMRVQVNNAVVVGPTNQYNETWVLPDDGVGSSPRTARGGILLQATDFNPERIQLDGGIYPDVWPDLSVGAHLTTPAIGIMDFDYGDFQVLVTSAYEVNDTTQVTREVTTLSGSAEQVTIATFNVENLPGDAAPEEFDRRADQIVNHLGSPDILVLEEIQDNNGTTNDGVVDATDTYNALISAIQAAGGPAYTFAQIDPTNDEDGGAPGGNIRQGFLYNPARVTFTPRAGGDATTPNSVTCDSGAPQIVLNPGRIDPTNSAFEDSRKPLVGQFEFNGESIFVVGVHFNSKGGDTPLFGDVQPPTLVSEAQRLQQATVVNGFVSSILSCAPDASVIVLGDMNDFTYSPPVMTLEGSILHNLFDLLPLNEQYSYVYEGNSQVLDQMVVSDYLRNDATPSFDVVHVNSEFTDQVSDHDPSVAAFAPVKLVDVDIRPLSRLNPINLQSNRKVTAAILSTPDFYAGSVDPDTVTLAGAPVATILRGVLLTTLIDINGDHLKDLVMLFNARDLQLSNSDTEAVLLGKTYTGTKVRGVDAVRIVDSDALLLISPEDGAKVNTRTPTFEWDGDPDAVCYRIEIDSDPNFRFPLVQSATVVRSTDYTADRLKNGTYYWRVQVGALCGGIAGQWSDTWRVVVNNGQ